uniref:ribosomal protein S11 n=1 Tax=Bostrychia moritziana TaxID=103713 RepID=UPI002E76D0D0|nr:ribosomal protein S11 [Bostrychia moritziana]WQF69395.1 ribosomal protein S11 [Bostrychia moritziana]
MLSYKNNVFILILFTPNNIFTTIINYNKNILYKKSLGVNKIKGLKKLTQSSIKNISNEISNFLKDFNFKFHLKLKGLNKFKKIVLKTIFLNFKRTDFVLSISDETIIPYNGCKRKKKRRL